jgi:methionine--tRNA ligase beta chain
VADAEKGGARRRGRRGGGRRDGARTAAVAAAAAAMTQGAVAPSTSSLIGEAAVAAAADAPPAPPAAEPAIAAEGRAPRARRGRGGRHKEKPVSDNPPDRKPEEAAAAAPLAAPPFGPTVTPERIDISEFARVELRAARVLAAEKIAGSKKLVKMQVDLGSETRQLVAGIAESYAPESLVGRTLIVVANLKPAKLMGVESNGMVLAGSVDGKAVLCTFDAEVAPGTKVK